MSLELPFNSENFGNMPFELSVYDLVTTDANYADFKGKGPARLLL